MSLELVEARAEHVAEISRIAYEGFREVSQRHGFQPDFANAESARPVFDLIVHRSDYFGVIAMLDNRPVGSNFVMLSDQVAAIGPLSVAPGVQRHGIGRLLMSTLIAHASLRNFTQIRLLADSHNIPALSLYSSLGFEARETTALLMTAPLKDRDDTVRRATDSDLPTIDALSQRIYRASRKNEIIVSAQYGFGAFLRERDGRATGYVLPGLVGHSAAESVDDTISLISESTRNVPAPFHKFLCPMSQSGLLQQSIKAGWRIEKLLIYMTLGAYEKPTGIWTPSACY